MALSDIRKSVSSVFEERINSPFYGSFIFSWLIWNWKIVYLTIFVSQDLIKPATKIDYILNHYINWVYLLLFPFLSAIVLVTIVPMLSNFLYKVSLFYEKQRIVAREKHEKSKLLSIEDSMRINNELYDQSEKHQRLIAKKDNEINFLDSRVRAGVEEVERLKTEIADLKKETFKIIYAQYGKEDQIADVSEIISLLLIQKNTFEINNQNLGIDPAPGIKKDLFIIYQGDGNIHTLKSNEYYSIQLNYNKLEVKETERSRIKYKTHENVNLQKYFPGKWKLIYMGKISGEEEFEIMGGNKYYIHLGISDRKYVFDLEDIIVDETLSEIEFTKVGIHPDKRKTRNKLKIVEKGKRYDGIEENGNIQVSYFRIM